MLAVAREAGRLAAAWDERVEEYNARRARKTKRQTKADAERGQEMEEEMAVISLQEQLEAVLGGVSKAVTSRKRRAQLLLKLPEKRVPPPEVLNPLAFMPKPLAGPPADLPCGTVEKLENGRMQVISGELPSQEELQTWTAASQAAYWEQRKKFWGRLRMTELQRECRKRKLWPGGDQPNLKDRLIRYDCFRTSLHKVEIEQEPEAPGLAGLEAAPPAAETRSFLRRDSNAGRSEK